MPAVPPPRIVSWNVTYRCRLRCPHCYVDAGDQHRTTGPGTAEGMALLGQLADAGTRIVILSGGEPLLRDDVFALARHGTNLGLRMAMGTSGIMVTGEVAGRLRESGIRKVAVSLDSAGPELHDRFRGYPGAFDLAVRGIEHLLDHDVPVQLNTTVTRENFSGIPDIIHRGKEMGVRDFHLFFLVPTGRGSTIQDITPDQYEAMIRSVLELSSDEGILVRPTCAPQFVRIARELGLSRSEWRRGCIAGRSYCRVDPSGEVTPCPYLPVSVGNMTRVPFRDIWESSPVLGLLRDHSLLEGKCGRCEFSGTCGGCRARAYGVSRLAPYLCGDLDRPGDLLGNLMAEEPWCPYEPGGGAA